MYYMHNLQGVLTLLMSQKGDDNTALTFKPLSINERATAPDLQHKQYSRF